MNLLTKIIALVVLIVVAGFVLVHILPYVLGMLALVGGLKLYDAFKNRQP